MSSPGHVCWGDSGPAQVEDSRAEYYRGSQGPGCRVELGKSWGGHARLVPVAALSQQVTVSEPS